MCMMISRYVLQDMLQKTYKFSHKCETFLTQLAVAIAVEINS